jgi:hypothetical protein
MKKLVLIFGLLAMTSIAQAKLYGTAGCGLGNLLLGKKDNQILAATTNNTGTQTFGITSGTSNCVDAGAVKEARAVSVFIELNKVALSDDIAKGHGEHLTSLAQLLKCHDKQDFGSRMQKSYRLIFPNAETQPDDVETSIRELIHTEKSLTQNCVG